MYNIYMSNQKRIRVVDDNRGATMAPSWPPGTPSVYKENENLQNTNTNTKKNSWNPRKLGEKIFRNLKMQTTRQMFERRR